MTIDSSPTKGPHPASRSPHRAAMLKNAGIDMQSHRRGNRRTRRRGAARRNRHGCRRHRRRYWRWPRPRRFPPRLAGCHVIGSDQTLGLDGEMLHKPADMEGARRRLLQLSGRTHQLNSAVCIVLDGETLWSHVEVCTLRFRESGSRALSAVIWPRSARPRCQASAPIRSRAAAPSLFEKIDGDFFLDHGAALAAAARRAPPIRLDRSLMDDPTRP